MKSYQEIEATIKENSAAIAELDALAKSAKWSERTEPRIVDACKRAELLRIENKILHDNARRAYFAEVIPAVYDEIMKYQGKQYGDKTKEKIRDACKKRVSCAAYISQSYSRCVLHLVPLDENGYSGNGRFGYNDFNISLNYPIRDERDMLKNNRIQEFAIDDLYITDCGEYVEDAHSRAELIKLQFSEVEKAWKVYQSACSTFNRLLPSTIEHANEYSAPRGYIL